MTGFVAATGMSYVCPDTTKDPLYIEGAAGSRSSLTVPLIYPRNGDRHAQRREPAARRLRRPRPPVHRDLRPQHRRRPQHPRAATGREGQHGQSRRSRRINRELALPLDDIITDATTVLDRYAGHDEDIIARLRHLLYRAREIRSLIHKAGSTVVPQPRQTQPAPRLAWPGRASSSSTPTRRSAGPPITCSAARGRASKRPATPTRPSR